MAKLNLLYADKIKAWVFVNGSVYSPARVVEINPEGERTFRTRALAAREAKRMGVLYTSPGSIKVRI